ncbi:MAG: 50S ribosomal protein L32 [Chloroflexi bacterium]|nr:50S ribosomal protein L32 [Chloroflexota bacterium]
MAPLPKKKRTHARQGNRWSHSQLRPVALTTCPQCRALKPPHLVCPNCGHYRGREVVVISRAESRQGG